MATNNEFSDYGSGSGSSISPSPPWVTSDSWSIPELDQMRSCLQELALCDQPVHQSSSLSNVYRTKRSYSDVMQEFRMNGSDQPYEPDDDELTWRRQAGKKYSGMGPAGGYLRQKSWPEPEVTPRPPLPKVGSVGPVGPANKDWSVFTDVQNWGEEDPVTPLPQGPCTPVTQVPQESITLEQMRVLLSLPEGVVCALLRDLQGRVGPGKKQECRFCKNNGERVAYYGSHSLKDGGGRVACPVLRAYVCRQCGASGDYAHTLRYCPFTSDRERMKSAAITRSVRMASGRKRSGNGPATDQMWTEPASIIDNPVWDQSLEPVWAALEQKLLL